MSLVQQINSELTDAMRQKDAVRLSALRMLKTAMTYKATALGAELNDEQAVGVVRFLVKQRLDSIAQFKTAGRQDLVDKETADLAVLQTYMPPELDPAVIEQAVVEAIAETGATSPKDMGKVMKAATARLAGQAVNGSTLSELVKKKLSGA